MSDPTLYVLDELNNSFVGNFSNRFLTELTIICFSFVFELTILNLLFNNDSGIENDHKVAARYQENS